MGLSLLIMMMGIVNVPKETAERRKKQTIFVVTGPACVLSDVLC